MFDISAILVLDRLSRIVRGVDGLPGLPENEEYRAWLAELVREHEVIMGENAYRRFSSKDGVLPCERMVVLARRENIKDLEKAARDNPQKTVLIPRVSLLGGAVSFADVIGTKQNPTAKRRKKKMFVVGGPHALYRLTLSTSQLYLTRTEGKEGDVDLQGEYLSYFPRETGKYECGAICAK